MSGTDLSLWANNATTSQPKWENRAKIIAHFIRPGDTVLDLGAGDRKLRKYIPASCGYIPVDCTDALPGTCVIDFNVEFKLPAEKFNVIVSAGFVEYLIDLEGFIRRLASGANGAFFIFTYSYSKDNVNKSEKVYKKLNRLTDTKSCIDIFMPYTDNLREAVRLKNQSIFTCTLTSEPRNGVCSTGTINEALAPTPFWKRWLAK